MIDPATFNTLRQFRAGVYDCFGARRDALFELLDAATVAGLVPSLAYLSLPPVHRRRWGSLYDALAAGTLEAPALRELVARYPLDDGQPIYALDTSVWPRDDAETSPGRGHYFSSARQSAGKPIVTGWSYSWLAQLSFMHDSWTAPLDVQRVPAGGNVHAVAAAQIQNHARRGSYRSRPTVRGTLVLVEVERLPRQTRIPRRLWLWWRGPDQPDLAVVWRAYVHRFDLEHTYRFCKQTLNWTTPRVRHPEQADRWTWLVTLAYTQLRLARRTIEDVHLPWEQPQRPNRRVLTAARVRQAFPHLLVTLETPANAPKPCGRSPGRPKGARSGRAPRFPAFKKAA